MTLEHLEDLPELQFMQTRKIEPNSTIELALIAPKRLNPTLIQLDGPYNIFGKYTDKNNIKFLVYASSERPFGGFPEVIKFTEILNYKIIKN